MKSSPIRSSGPGRRRQRGISLFGLVFWAIVISFLGYIAVSVLPTLNEYFTIQRAVDKIAASNPSTVADARKAFERQKDIEYSITSITANDLDITKDGDRVVISYGYDKEVPVMGPVFILLKYRGQSK